MTARRALRLALTAEWAAVVVGGILMFLLEDSLPEPLRAYLKAEEERSDDAAFWATAAAALTLLVGMVVSTVGLFKGRRWALHLCLGTTLASYLLSSALGPTVSHALSYSVLSLATLLNGAVLALGYFTDALGPQPKPAAPVQ